MPRLFLGLALPEPVKKCLMSWSSDIPGARWQRREQLHLTLCFLGEVAPERVPALFRALDGLEAPAFDLEPMGVSCFGDPEQPRTLWAGAGPEDFLRSLHGALCQRLEHSGFRVEARRFHPHITLARFSRHQAGPAGDFLKQFRNEAAPVFTVDGVSLFLSQPGPDGSRYQQLALFPLVESSLKVPHEQQKG
ncbi:RNA 2',3'-cyclic phosphodiesterase [Marinobacter lacisalsi]|uniref:RNA 2',3'-cyclic phosphodiesterase n=1 Tax=Marinobacter lacisalsi TaxID=475979 RepID=A0ABV8QL04_9GAMM